MTNKLGSANPNRIPQRKKVFKDREYSRLAKIYKYYKVPDLFETSGQPNEQQLNLIAKLNYKVVINLASESKIDGIAVDEENILKSLKIKYIHIPVNFNNPTKEDFKEFVLSIEKYKGQKIWVHCAANMRVSAFIYKYRKDVLNLSHNKIINDMMVIWIPNKIWSLFLDLDNK